MATPRTNPRSAAARRLVLNESRQASAQKKDCFFLKEYLEQIDYIPKDLYGIANKVTALEEYEASQRAEGKESCLQPSAKKRKLSLSSRQDKLMILVGNAYDIVDRGMLRLDKAISTLNAKLQQKLPEVTANPIDENFYSAKNRWSPVQENDSTVREARFAVDQALSKALAEHKTQQAKDREARQREKKSPAQPLLPPVLSNEPLYCVCQNISYGEMIACDNDACRLEWFHYGCVGLDVNYKPSGSWLCTECTENKTKKEKKAETGRPPERAKTKSKIKIKIRG